VRITAPAALEWPLGGVRQWPFSERSACQTGTNGTTVGTPAITFDELVEAMRSGGAYVNVHTDDGEGEQNTGPGDMASGEIRGQIEAEE
jgi:hypothetical protein